MTVKFYKIRKKLSALVGIFENSLFVTGMTYICKVKFLLLEIDQIHWEKIPREYKMRIRVL